MASAELGSLRYEGLIRERDSGFWPDSFQFREAKFTVFLAKHCITKTKISTPTVSDLDTFGEPVTPLFYY